MRRIFCSVLGAIALATCVSACSLPSLLGAPAIELTGDFSSDWPKIKSYAAAVKAGVNAKRDDIRQAFQAVCPKVSDAQVRLATNVDVVRAGADKVTNGNGGKVVNNAATTLNVAAKACATGTAPDWKTTFMNAVDAVETIESLIRTGSSN
jgi:hypothetical protein